jgi:hypothetical protein
MRACAYEVLFSDDDARLSRHFARLYPHSAIIGRSYGELLRSAVLLWRVLAHRFLSVTRAVRRQPSVPSTKALGIKYKVQLYAAVAEAYQRTAHVTT